MIYQDRNPKNFNTNNNIDNINNNNNTNTNINNNNIFFINQIEHNGIENIYNDADEKNDNPINLLDDTENLDPILNFNIDYNYNYGPENGEFNDSTICDRENILLLSTSSSNRNNLIDVDALQDLNSDLYANLDLNLGSDLNSNLFPNLNLNLNAIELDTFNEISSTNSVSTTTTPLTENFIFTFDGNSKGGNAFDEYSLDYHSSTSNIIYSNKLKDKLRQKRNSLSMGTIKSNSSKSISPVSPTRSRSFTTTNYYYNNNSNNIRLRDGIRYRSKSIGNLSNHKLKNSFLSSPNNPFYKPPDILRRLSDSE